MELGGIASIAGGKPVQMDKKGKITVRIGEREVVLKGALVAPHTEIGTGQGEVNEPALLIGLRKFARDTGISMTFRGDGETVEMADEGLIARYKASPGDMYIIDQNSVGSSERATIRAFPVSAQDTNSDVVLGGREMKTAVIKLECAGIVQGVLGVRESKENAVELECAGPEQDALDKRMAGERASNKDYPLPPHTHYSSPSSHYSPPSSSFFLLNSAIALLIVPLRCLKRVDWDECEFFEVLFYNTCMLTQLVDIGTLFKSHGFGLREHFENVNQDPGDAPENKDLGA